MTLAIGRTLLFCMCREWGGGVFIGLRLSPRWYLTIKPKHAQLFSERYGYTRSKTVVGICFSLWDTRRDDHRA